MKINLFIISILIILIPSIAFGCNILEEVGEPITEKQGILLCHEGYSNYYSTTTKTPIWVGEHLLKQNLLGFYSRKGNFRKDPLLNTSQSSSSEDYYGSGYARGHNAPAGNYKHSQSLMMETFFMSNMVPQIQKCNNSGVWSKLEDYIRDQTFMFGESYIVTGPIYSENYKVIGNGVGVPDYLYKVVLMNNTFEAYIVPNKELCGYTYESFKVTIDDVEKLTNIRFFPKIR